MKRPLWLITLSTHMVMSCQHSCLNASSLDLLPFLPSSISGRYCMGFSSSAFPELYISGVHHCWWDFYVYDHFFNPTIEVVTFHLHGWGMLGMLLLPAFTNLGHERQDLLSSYWWNACVPEAQGRVKPTTLHHAGQRAQNTTHWAILAPLHGFNGCIFCSFQTDSHDFNLHPLSLCRLDLTGLWD